MDYHDIQARAMALCRRAHMVLMGALADCHASPLRRNIMRASALLTFAGLACAGSAYGQATDGVASMVHKGRTQASSVKTDAGVIFAAIGFILAGYGGFNWFKKGKEGDHSQIKAGQIIVPILAGAVLGATGYVMYVAGETVGIERAAHGGVPT